LFNTSHARGIKAYKVVSDRSSVDSQHSSGAAMVGFAFEEFCQGWLPIGRFCISGHPVIFLGFIVLPLSPCPVTLKWLSFIHSANIYRVPSTCQKGFQELFSHDSDTPLWSIYFDERVKVEDRKKANK
jgi:hypothetical protein